MTLLIQLILQYKINVVNLTDTYVMLKARLHYVEELYSTAIQGDSEIWLKKLITGSTHKINGGLSYTIFKMGLRY